MALLNYKRMLTAERFCLCQLSQQPQLKELIQQPLEGEKAALLGWTNCASARFAVHGVKWRLNLLVNVLQILQFYFSTLLPSSSLHAVALTPHCSSEARISTAREAEQQVQPPVRSGALFSSRTSGF